MQLNPKKIIGSLGRKYGGKPFQKIRKFYYDSIAFSRQLYELSFLMRGTYAPGHPDKLFYKMYYTDNGFHDNEKITRGVICMCDGRQIHGGLTDRLRGILTTYRDARKKNYPFYIYWVTPFLLEDYLQPAKIDWRIKAENLCYDKSVAFPFIIEDEPEFQSWLRMKIGFRQWKKQIHVYSNANDAVGSFKVLYNELFQPSPKLQKEIRNHLEKLGDKYVAFSFRFLKLLGDFDDCSFDVLNEEDGIKLIEKVIDEFLKLSKEVPKNYKILITSDSTRFLAHIKDKDPRIYIVPGDIKHIDRTVGDYPDIWMKTFLDQQLLMNAEKVTLMRTEKMYKSGFPKFAAEVGGATFVDHSF